MVTLIAWYNSEGCIGRCDAKCTDAQHPDCKCICDGKNHGVGLHQAIENTRDLAERWVEHWKAQHPEAERVEVNPAVAQLDLFRGGGTPEIETPTLRDGRKSKKKHQGRAHSSPLSSHHQDPSASPAACAFLHPELRQEHREIPHEQSR